MPGKMTKWQHSIARLVLGLALTLPGLHPAEAQTAVVPSGTGLTSDTAYQITSVGNLVWMRDQAATVGSHLTKGKYYKLANNIDASATSKWNDSGTSTNLYEGFRPIGTDALPFQGVFLGNSHKISGLVINRPATDYVGLFGYADSNARISQLGISGGSVKGAYAVGPLVGLNSGGSISQCYATATVSGEVAGGLAAINTAGTVSQSYATGAVTGTTSSGGLIGSSTGVLYNCYATGNVTGTSTLGGLAGYGAGTIAQCYATGKVSGQTRVGGFLGAGYAAVSQCYATGAVTGTGSEVGGFIGQHAGPSVLTFCYATGAVTGAGDYIGGLVGNEQGSANLILKCCASGAVTGAGADVGGLVGNNYSCTIAQSYAVGAVTGKSSSTGGLVGYNNYAGAIAQSYAVGRVSGVSIVGGLVGYNYNSVSQCYSAGAVSGTTNIGGLAGSSSGSIMDSYWDMQTSGRSTSAGGLGVAGRTTAQMRLQSTFANWGFTSIWAIQKAYPYLRAFPTYTLKYSAGAQGLVGDGTTTATTLTQTVNAGSMGQPVKAVGSGRYVFQFWDDARADNPRTDAGVMGAINVTAYFRKTGNAARDWEGYR